MRPTRRRSRRTRASRRSSRRSAAGRRAGPGRRRPRRGPRRAPRRSRPPRCGYRRRAAPAGSSARTRSSWPASSQAARRRCSRATAASSSRQVRRRDQLLGPVVAGDGAGRAARGVVLREGVAGLAGENVEHPLGPGPRAAPGAPHRQGHRGGARQREGGPGDGPGDQQLHHAGKPIALGARPAVDRAQRRVQAAADRGRDGGAGVAVPRSAEDHRTTSPSRSTTGPPLEPGPRLPRVTTTLRAAEPSPKASGANTVRGGAAVAARPPAPALGVAHQHRPTRGRRARRPGAAGAGRDRARAAGDVRGGVDVDRLGGERRPAGRDQAGVVLARDDVGVGGHEAVADDPSRSLLQQPAGAAAHLHHRPARPQRLGVAQHRLVGRRQDGRGQRDQREGSIRARAPSSSSGGTVRRRRRGCSSAGPPRGWRSRGRRAGRGPRPPRARPARCRSPPHHQPAAPVDPPQRLAVHPAAQGRGQPEEQRLDQQRAGDRRRERDEREPLRRAPVGEQQRGQARAGDRADGQPRQRQQLLGHPRAAPSSAQSTTQATRMTSTRVT